MLITVRNMEQYNQLHCKKCHPNYEHNKYQRYNKNKKYFKCNRCGKQHNYGYDMVKKFKINLSDESEKYIESYHLEKSDKKFSQCEESCRSRSSNKCSPSPKRKNSNRSRSSDKCSPFHKRKNFNRSDKCSPSPKRKNFNRSDKSSEFFESDKCEKSDFDESLEFNKLKKCIESDKSDKCSESSESILSDKCNQPEKKIAIYGSVYNLAEGITGPQLLALCGNVTPPTTNIVKFSNRGPSNQIKFNGTNALILPVKGVYQAEYNVDAIPSQGSQISFGLIKSSKKSNIVSTIPGSVSFASVGTDNAGSVNGNVIFKGKKGDQIQLTNNLLADTTLKVPSNAFPQPSFCETPINASLDIVLLK